MYIRAIFLQLKMWGMLSTKVLGKVKKIYATVVASLRISKLKKKRGAAAAAHCSHYPLLALKHWAKERSEHYVV
jgi:hypothetical protein